METSKTSRASGEKASTGSVIPVMGNGEAVNMGDNMGNTDNRTGTDSVSGERSSRLRNEATKLKNQAVERVRSSAASGKERTSGVIANLAQAARDAAERIEKQENPQVAQYTRQAADRLDRLSTTLRQKDIDELVTDVRDYVRRSPAVAIGVAVAVGFTLARFLKASHRDEERTTSGPPSVNKAPGATSGTLNA